jgi:hypothetical protein
MSSSADIDTPEVLGSRLIYSGWFDMMIVPEAANMPPTPWQTEILAPGDLGGG